MEEPNPDFVTYVLFPTVDDIAKFVMKDEEVPLMKDKEHNAILIFTKGGRPTAQDIHSGVFVFKLKYLQTTFENFQKAARGEEGLMPLEKILGGYNESETDSSEE